MRSSGSVAESLDTWTSRSKFTMSSERNSSHVLFILRELESGNARVLRVRGGGDGTAGVCGLLELHLLHPLRNLALEAPLGEGQEAQAMRRLRDRPKCTIRQTRQSSRGPCSCAWPARKSWPPTQAPTRRCCSTPGTQDSVRCAPPVRAKWSKTTEGTSTFPAD